MIFTPHTNFLKVVCWFSYILHTILITLANSLAKLLSPFSKWITLGANHFQLIKNGYLWETAVIYYNWCISSSTELPFVTTWGLVISISLNSRITKITPNILGYFKLSDFWQLSYSIAYLCFPVVPTTMFRNLRVNILNLAFMLIISNKTLS